MDIEHDKTKSDLNRRLLNLQRAEITNALPEYFGIDYPQLKALFEAYYEFLDSSGRAGGQIHDLYANRDATQVPEELLKYLEDELLLGQATFGGFQNKREAIKFSNQLYRSKGTKYSVQQFFRGFYGVDPTIIYPKENIFRVGPSINWDQDSINTAGQQVKQTASQLGPESQKYLTDDKLYQVMSILIKSSIPVDQWKNAYQLFVHPAGAHLAAQIVLELVNGNVVQSLRESGPGIAVPSTFQIEGIANMNLLGYTDLTLLQQGDGTIGMMRTDRLKTMQDLQNVSMDSASANTMRGLVTPNSLRMSDSDVVTYVVQGKPSAYDDYVYYDSGNTVRRFGARFGSGPYRGHNTGMTIYSFGTQLSMFWEGRNIYTGNRHGIPAGADINTWYQPEADYTKAGFDSSAFVNPEHIVGKPITNNADKVANIPGLIVKHPSNSRFAFRIDSDVYSTYDTTHPNAPFGVFSGYRFALTLMVQSSKSATFDRDSSAETLMPTFDEHRYQTLFDSSANSADSAHYPTGP
mgnify:CR=1 FL=1